MRVTGGNALKIAQKQANFKKICSKALWQRIASWPIHVSRV